MKFNDLEFQPIILGADITAYSLARSFHEQYGIKSITLSMTQTGYVNSSDIIENRYYPNMEKDEVAVERLIEVGKEFLRVRRSLSYSDAVTGMYVSSSRIRKSLSLTTSFHILTKTF